MAVDTAAKRHSALAWGQPWRTNPRPSGTIDQGARQATAFVYSGILAGAAVPEATTYGRLEYTVPFGLLHYTVPSGRLEFTVQEP